MIKSKQRVGSGTALIASAALSFAVPASGRADEAQGAVVFSSRCAVCHGPEAAGIPGAFPSLHEQIMAFGASPEGRDYLVMVVTTGLMGDLKIAGTGYRGVMPAQSGLSDAEVAAVLTYLASGRVEAHPPLFKPADVAAARDRHADRTPQATRALRPAYPES